MWEGGNKREGGEGLHQRAVVPRYVPTGTFPLVRSLCRGYLWLRYLRYMAAARQTRHFCPPERVWMRWAGSVSPPRPNRPRWARIACLIESGNGARGTGV